MTSSHSAVSLAVSSTSSASLPSSPARKAAVAAPVGSNAPEDGRREASGVLESELRPTGLMRAMVKVAFLAGWSKQGCSGARVRASATRNGRKGTHKCFARACRLELRHGVVLERLSAGRRTGDAVEACAQVGPSAHALVEGARDETHLADLPRRACRPTAVREPPGPPAQARRSAASRARLGRPPRLTGPGSVFCP